MPKANQLNQFHFFMKKKGRIGLGLPYYTETTTFYIAQLLSFRLFTTIRFLILFL